MITDVAKRYFKQTQLGAVILRGKRQAMLDEKYLRLPDPWNYRTSDYEHTKYQQTLEALPKQHYHRAMEIGCAEGIFTKWLAPRVDQLIAGDISPVALERARKECKRHGNIEFIQYDLVTDAPPGQFDLILCAEVLYYAGESIPMLRRVRNRILSSLDPGGHLVLVHMRTMREERTGWDLHDRFGAKTIHGVFFEESRLRTISNRQEEKYAIAVFQKE